MDDQPFALTPALLDVAFPFHLVLDRQLRITQAGTSIQRRSLQLASAASTSCTPLAPSGRVHLYGASSTTWRMKCSHWILKPLS